VNCERECASDTLPSRSGRTKVVRISPYTISCAYGGINSIIDEPFLYTLKHGDYHKSPDGVMRVGRAGAACFVALLWTSDNDGQFLSL
jgi:hypothetical protein